MKKILLIHNKYRYMGGEDIAVENEINFLKEGFEVETLFFENNVTNVFSEPALVSGLKIIFPL